jgi:hypothetical protein
MLLVMPGKESLDSKQGSSLPVHQFYQPRIEKRDQPWWRIGIEHIRIHGTVRLHLKKEGGKEMQKLFTTFKVEKREYYIPQCL